METERRFDSHAPTVSERRDGDTVLQSISGYAAVFHRDGDTSTEYALWDGAVERIMPGAFDRALDADEGTVALFNHNFDNLLGRTEAGTLSLSVDKTGLRYTIEANDSQLFGEVRDMIGRGDLTGSSFQFTLSEEGATWTRDGETDVREIREVGRLIDVGPVVMPAYSGTTTRAKAELATLLAEQAKKREKETERERELRELELAAILRDS